MPQPSRKAIPTLEEISNFVHSYSHLLMVEFDDGACKTAQNFEYICPVTWQVTGLRKFALIPITTGVSIGEVVKLQEVTDDILQCEEPLQATVHELMLYSDKDHELKLESSDKSFHKGSASKPDDHPENLPLQHLALFGHRQVKITKVAEQNSFPYQNNSLHALEYAYEFEMSEEPEQYADFELPSYVWSIFGPEYLCETPMALDKSKVDAIFKHSLVF